MTADSFRPVAVIYHPGFRDFAGAEMVSAWLLQALSETHDVAVWTEYAPDWPRIDSRFSTSLARNPPRWFKPSLVCRVVKACLGTKGQLLQLSLVQRHLRVIDRKHPGGLWLSGYNEAWLPARGVLYIHHPERLRIPSAPAAWTAWRRFVFTKLQMASLRIGLSAAVPPTDQRKLANSDWTRKTYALLGGGDAMVLHPPVPPFAPGLPWAERADRVVMLGRWSPAKRLEQAIAIIEGTRQAGVQLTLAFAGFWHCPDAYRSEIEALARRHNWIEWHEKPTREEVIRLAGSSRYGLHTMESEHFGIAVAELATAGCVVLVPDSGGPREIVEDPRQIYTDRADAITKLLHLVGDAQLQRELHDRARARGLRFSPEQFRRNLRALLPSLLSNT